MNYENIRYQFKKAKYVAIGEVYALANTYMKQKEQEKHIKNQVINKIATTVYGLCPQKIKTILNIESIF